MGSPVQHIVRWSPQDWLTSRVRTRSIVTGRPMLRLIYREILDALYEAGGAISADPVDLQDKIAVPLADIEECLPVLLEIGQRGRGGLRVEHLGGLPVLVCRRVTEEIEDDIAYRNTQSEHGKKGGRPRKATLTDEHKEGVNVKGTLQSEKGTLSEKKGTPSPPVPSPSPVPMPTPLPESKNARGARYGPPPAADTTPGEGKGGKASRPKREKPPPILEVPDLPELLDTPAFRAAMAARLRERAEQPGAAARQTAEQIAAQVRQLAKVAAVNGIAYAVDCVERAISGHHQAVVFPKDDYEPRNGNGKRGALPDPRYDPKLSPTARLQAHGADPNAPPSPPPKRVPNQFVIERDRKLWEEHNARVAAERAANTEPS